MKKDISRKKKDPRHIALIVEEVCDRLGMTDACEQYSALQSWKDIVGETIAAQTTIERLTKGQLYIRVKNSVWRMELNFRKKELAEKMNAQSGTTAIQEIIFR